MEEGRSLSHWTIEQSQEESDHSPILLEESDNGREDKASAPSFGKDAKLETENFPELMDRAAQAVGLTSSSKNLKRAIAQQPQQVEGAIVYLQNQQ